MSCILLSRSIGGVFVDVVVSERHESELEIAEHPVESGAKISDHAWRKRRRVTLEGAVNSPRAISAFEQLLALQEAAEPFSLVTGLKVYQNMLIERLEAERDKDYARILKFTAECSEVIIVSTESGSAGAAADGSSTSSDSAKGTSNRGQVSARTSQSIPSRTNSILSNAIATD